MLYTVIYVQYIQLYFTSHMITIDKQYKKQTVKIFFTIYFWKSNE